MNFWTQLTEQARSIWQKLSGWQKATFAGVVLLFLVVTTIIFVQKPKMEVLYSGLSPETASAMTEKLQELKVPYELVDEGKTILVNADKKYQLRLDLANEVNLSGVIGFESFNETRFGETDTDKRVRFLVALQGELTRTIEEMDEVESANVHIALPQSSLFIRDEKEASASILLRLKSNAVMDTKNVKSIMSFVSHSVEGLKPENVTVMDVQGNLLSEGIAEGSELDPSKISASQLALKQQYEKEFSQSILSMLEKMRGVGKAIVRANVDIDFDKVETYSEKYGDAVHKSEQIHEESSTGTSPATGGNPADANMSSGITYGSGNSTVNSEYEVTDQVRNYEISRVTETRIVAPGKVTKLSLAVIVDGELTPAEETKIRDAVAMAAGINVERGDQVSVVGMPFNNAVSDEMQQALADREKFQRTMEVLKVMIVPLSILLILGFLLYFIRRFFANQPMNPLNNKRGQQEIAAMAEMEEVELNLSPEAIEKRNMQKQIDNLINNKPEEVAKVIKTWLVEE